MASGILARLDMTINSNNSVYTVPASKVASVTLSLCNRGGVDAAVKVALSTSSSPANGDYIEWNTVIPIGSVFERTGIVMDASKIIVITPDVANVSAVVYGFEE